MKRSCGICFLLAIAVAMADVAAAQGRPGQPGQPSIMQSLTEGPNANQPVQIEAATLEVRDKAKMATVSGNVKVVQGDTTMKCQTLVVFYDKDARPGAGKSAPGMPDNAQSIRRIEARGGVTVITKDQNATGELGIFDMKTNTITLSGNVVVSQGQNVVHGDRVVVDMTSGVSRVESEGKTGQTRVRALIQPNKGDNANGPPKIMPVGPTKLN
jgi:lipopolysaccharide export system protein LptA